MRSRDSCSLVTVSTRVKLDGEDGILMDLKRIIFKFSLLTVNRFRNCQTGHPVNKKYQVYKFGIFMEVYIMAKSNKHY